MTAPKPVPRPPTPGGSARARYVRQVLADQGDEWKTRAACRDHPRPDIFYPPPARADDDAADLSQVKRNKREQRRRIVVAEAKSVCRRCPVRARMDVERFGIPPGGTGECLDYADAIGDYHGIWGGLTALERGRKRDER